MDKGVPVLSGNGVIRAFAFNVNIIMYEANYKEYRVVI